MNRINIYLAVVGVAVGLAIGFPLGNKTVTKVVTKTTTKNISSQLAIGQTEAQAAQSLSTKGSSGGTKTIGGKKFQCVIYYGKVDAKGIPQDWYATFCGS